MIKVYRIGRKKYANDLTGEGARLFGGRWNHKSVPCIYASESRALSLLEYTVNISIEEIPRALSITTIEIPDSSIQKISVAKLPGNWQKSPAPTETKDFGVALFKSSIYSVFRIPSTILPDEFNYLLNPLHADSKHFKIVDVVDFIYDLRIKGV
ncbi:MAG: RES family NAD+ phosphorylase [Ginsengibacter sp.]